MAALAHQSVPFRLVGRAADVGFVTPHHAGQIGEILGEIRAAQDQAGRAGETVHVFGDLLVFLDADEATARARRQRLDDWAGAAYTGDAFIFAGPATDLADILAEWHAAGLSGFRLRPGALPHDLIQITDGLVPALQARGLCRRGYESATLRGLLDLPRPANRYSANPAMAEK